MFMVFYLLQTTLSQKVLALYILLYLKIVWIIAIK